MKKLKSKPLHSLLLDSDNTSKNSKWLQENLTDMDSKVKALIKHVEEDADSFSRRAELYYKKRPELMKLVEELYRAYRALAERYASVISEHHRDAQNTLNTDVIKEENLEIKLKKAQADLISEKVELLGQYQSILEKLSNTDKELNHVVEESRILEETTSAVEKEVNMLKETLRLLQAEMQVEELKNALLKLSEEKEALQVLYSECLEKSYKLELDLSSTQSHKHDELQKLQSK